MVNGIKYGTGFLVPGNGWYIFGGNAFQQAISTQVQSLSSIGNSWLINTLPTYSGDPSYGQCSVQVTLCYHQNILCVSLMLIVLRCKIVCQKILKKY